MISFKKYTDIVGDIDEERATENRAELAARRAEA